MDVPRRKFLHQLSTGTIMMPLIAGDTGHLHSKLTPSDPQVLKPQKLRPGDVIGLISPAGAVYESEPYEVAKEALEAMGVQVKLGKHLKDRYGHLAGEDDDRARELNKMFSDRNVHAIICLRGGFGAARILDKIDYKMIRKNPKVFIGYSDITALQLALYKKAGIVTFHGPVGISSWGKFSRRYFSNLLFNNQLVSFKNPPKQESEWVQTENRTRTIHPGKARGRLLGGNLSVLCGLMGSAYLPSFKGSLLFLEDVNEELYRIDRLMSQLQLSGLLDEINGFIFGKCTRCLPGGGYGSLTFDEIIDHYIKPLKIPAFSGSMIGHIDSKFTLPVGTEAEMDADKGTFQLLERALHD